MNTLQNISQVQMITKNGSVKEICSQCKAIFDLLQIFATVKQRKTSGG
jgi:hypothetical protein